MFRRVDSYLVERSRGGVCGRRALPCSEGRLPSSSARVDLPSGRLVPSGRVRGEGIAVAEPPERIIRAVSLGFRFRLGRGGRGAIVDARAPEPVSTPATSKTQLP